MPSTDLSATEQRAVEAILALPAPAHAVLADAVAAIVPFDAPMPATPREQAERLVRAVGSGVAIALMEARTRG